MTKVFLIGGNHWDETWVVDQDLVPGESVPIRAKRQPGGAAANMARALMAQGVGCDFASIYGQEVPPILGQHTRQVSSASSARYVSLENAQGEVLYGFADMDIYERHMTADWYDSLSPQADCVIIDCNGPEGALAQVHFDARLIALAVSPAKVRRLVPILDRLSLLFCNQAEAEALGHDLARVDQAVVTKGAAGATLYELGQATAHFPAPDWQPVTGNGLGDRLAGLILARVLQGKPLDQAVPEALEALPC